MAKKLFYSLMMLAMPLLSNAQQKLTPIQLNDKLVAITDSLYFLGKAWGTKFVTVAKDGKFSELAPLRIEFEEFIDKSILYVKNMDDMHDSKDLRTAMIALLQYEKKVIATAFKPMEQLDATSTYVQVNAAYEKLTAEAKTEQVEMEKIRPLLNAYAKKNNFTIQDRIRHEDAMNGDISKNNTDEATRAATFNNKLTEVIGSLNPLGTAWGNKFATLVESKKFSELAPLRIRFERFLDSTILVVKNMADVSDSKNLRMGVIAFLQFEKKLCATVFKPIELLSAKSTDAQLNAAFDKLTTEGKTEQAELEKFRVLQRAYALSNNFILNEGPTK